MNRATLLALATLAVVSVSACAKKAPVVPVIAALAIPTPPARTLIPVEIPPYVEPEPEPVAEAEPSPAPARPVPTTRATEKPAAPPPAAPAQPPVLQTTNTAPPSALEQRVRGLITSAEERLRAVNYRELGATGKAHWSQARDFIRMANDNLRVRNYAYAEQLATKANTVAGLLPRG